MVNELKQVVAFLALNAGVIAFAAIIGFKGGLDVDAVFGHFLGTADAWK